MAFTDVKYPVILDLKGSPGLQGSMDYMPRTDYRYFNVGEYIQIDNPGLDFNDNHDEASAKKFDIFTFTNGVKLRVKLWIQYYTAYGRSVQSVYGKICYVGTNNVEYKVTDLGNASSHNNYIDYVSPAGVNTYGIKVVLYNDYTSSGVAVEGTTQLAYLNISAFMPVMSEQTPGTMRTFAQIASSAHLKMREGTDRDPVDPTWLFYPSIMPGAAGDSNWGYFSGILYDNANAFAADISQGGPTVTPEDIIGERDPENPAQEEDPSTPGGGGGNYDDTSDPVPFPDLPTGGALSSGAIKAFQVTPTIMQTVFNMLWDSSIFDIPLQFQKLVDNPIDCIISFHCIPVTPSTSGQSNIKLGNLDTTTAAPVIDNQYLSVDCGSLNIKEFWGSALDYSPYTRVELFMPFIGIKELKAEDVMKSTVHIKYNIDIFTGDCLCNVKCGQSVLYKFAGNLKQDIPVSGRTNNMGVKGMMGAMTAFAGGMMGGAVGGPVGAAMGVGATLSAAASVASSKITTSRSGSISGSVGLLDDFRPFFIFHRPVQSLASNFKGHKGYPSNITKQLSSVSGYTEVEYINLQNIPNATDSEMEEIKTLLKKGVLI